MKSLKELLEGIPCSWNGKGELGNRINRVWSDSRSIKPGDLFVAIPGFKVDGRQFIGEALRRGASAIVTETFDNSESSFGIPQFCVPDSRAVLSRLVAASYDFPAKKLKCIGITGTNGKTTSAFLIQFLLNQISRSGLIGTICYDDGKARGSAGNTTPTPETLNEYFDRMVQNGLSYCVMEVSSHALDQNRTEGIAFSSAVFTNLTQDHLDYHKSYEEYYQAKRKLFFGSVPPRYFIINRDDTYGKRLVDELKGRGEIVAYGLNDSPEISAEEIEFLPSGTHFKFSGQGKRFQVRTPLMLRHNLYNTLAALSTLLAEKVDLEGIIPALSKFPGVPGRMEQIQEGQDFHVYVDYAHTPDGLYQVLSSFEDIPKNRVISVFGCGGDRDRVKRPMMGEAASRYSDVVILTSDNPRSENPEAILEEIKKGIDSSGKSSKILSLTDRAEAISYAIEIAEKGDVVLIFGKGHEEYQIFGTEKKPFSDQQTARYYLRKRCSQSGKSHKLAVEN